MNLTRRTLLGAAAAAAGSPRAWPQPTPTTPKPGRVSDPVNGSWDREGTVLRGGGRIHYYELEGPPGVNADPLICLNKLGGWAADWRHVAPALAAHRRVIALEPPGHGGSTMLGPAPYLQTVAESAAMIRAALEQLGLERYALLGNSLGGCISVLLASLWPESVSRLVLLSVSLADGESRAALAAQDVAARGINYDATDLPLMRTAAQLARFGSRDPAVIEENNRSRTVAGRWVRASERGVAVAGISGYLSAITAPTLLIYGDRGNYREFQSVGESKIPAARTVIIADSGAFTQQEQPAATVAAIEPFLA
jgi:pimeloyl-ACP methyl ester carboxylesterase